MLRTVNLFSLAVLAVIIAACLAGCGGASLPSADLPHVSSVPSENWATPDGYAVYVSVLPAGSTMSHGATRSADGCIHVKSTWKVDTWIIRNDSTEVALCGGIDGVVKIWDIGAKRYVPGAETKTGEWQSLPAGAYRLTGKLTSTDAVEPFETLIVE